MGGWWGGWEVFAVATESNLNLMLAKLMLGWVLTISIKIKAAFVCDYTDVTL